MKRLAACLTLLALLCLSRPVQADVIYAATGSGVTGNLYTLNPVTGAATVVGALVDSSGNHYGLTGLAFQPGTGTLYGATINAGGAHPGSLVTVNPATGLVTFIGSFTPGAMSDITFAPNGTLYGWHAFGDHSLYTINPATGAASLTSAATSPNPGFGGGGLASNLTGTIYSTPDSTSPSPPGHLDTVSTATGQLTVVGTLSGNPLSVINAMDFNSSGVLYGISSAQNGSINTHLVTINTSTAAITDVGSNGVSNLDALAILRTPAVPEPSTLVLTLLGVGSVGVAAWRKRRRQLASSPAENPAP
jgi:hypothetical protein